MLFDLAVGAVSLATFFVGGWHFLSFNLFNNYDDKDVTLQVMVGS